MNCRFRSHVLWFQQYKLSKMLRLAGGILHPFHTPANSALKPAFARCGALF
jgi:hypothetical protein